MTTVITEWPQVGDTKAEFNRKAFVVVGQIGAISQDINTLDANLASAVATVTSGLSAGLWVSGTTYAVGNLRFDPTDGRLYRRLTAGAGTTRPGLDATNWALQTLPDWPLVVVSGTTQTAAANTEYWMANSASSELTLPAAPSVGDTVRVGFANGRGDNYVRRNTQLLMGLAEDMLIDIPYWARRLRFVGGSTGWAVQR